MQWEQSWYYVNIITKCKSIVALCVAYTRAQAYVEGALLTIGNPTKSLQISVHLFISPMQQRIIGNK